MGDSSVLGGGGGSRRPLPALSFKGLCSLFFSFFDLLVVGIGRAWFIGGIIIAG